MRVPRSRAVLRLARRWTHRHAAWGRRLRVAAQITVVSLLAWRLSTIGWGDTLRALPTAPLFYAFVLASYAALPISDALIYGPWWRLPWATLVRASFRKRVYNEDVLEYSGEAAFVGWATRAGIERGRALRDVRDNNIISAIASMAFTLAVAAVALSWSGVGRSDSTDQLALFAALPLGALVVILVVLRGRVFALSLRETLRATAVNLGRLAVVAALTIGMWTAAVPEVGMEMWAVLLATQLLVSRVPLVPAKDLLFVGIGVELSHTLGEAQAAVAGALLVQVAATKGLNLLVLLGTTLLDRRAASALPQEAADGA